MSADQAVPPSGVVTFLFTELEGSTSRWEKDADGMRVAHDEVLRKAIEAHGAGCSSTLVIGCVPRSRRAVDHPRLAFLCVIGHANCSVLVVRS
ncbi:MAG: hypothetical protein WBW75_08185 [Mycobacterium sp.]|uniref:hypothetical protein n=1 Tax=Mycobacterium sp. TaxID=1785 RepID=UPI003C37CB97